jgi:hypothetical protein
MLSALGFGFDQTKFKPQLNMAIQRFKMVRIRCALVVVPS